MGLLEFFLPADDPPNELDAISFAETRAADSPEQQAAPALSLVDTLASQPGIRTDAGASQPPPAQLGTLDTIAPEAVSVGFDDTINPDQHAARRAPEDVRAARDPALGTRDTLASEPRLARRPLGFADTHASKRPTGRDLEELGSRDTMASDAHMRAVDAQLDTIDSRAPMRRFGQDLPRDLEYQRKRAELRARILGDPVERFAIGRFQVLKRLGEGGMGVVYAAYDETLDRKVAIKVLRGRASDTAQTRLLREAQALARLSHRNIVAVHEVGEHEGQTFLAMEFVRGQSLDKWLETPRPWREVLDVFLQAGRGLEAAHRAGLIHRDFKPHNAILGDDGQVKVLDFGLARASGAAPLEAAQAEDDAASEAPKGALAVSLTHTGAILGTPAYMAPEQHQGRPADARSDQFGFCAALYEGLYRQLPFDATTLAELITKIVEGELQAPPRDVNVPQWIRKILWTGLSVEPDARFPSMTALLAALERDPARQRRRVALAAGALTLMTGGSVALARLQAPEAAAPCADIPQLFDATWNDARRSTSAQVFTTSDLGFASDSWSVIEPTLDRYAADWSSARARSCEAHAGGLISDNLYDRASACFERRRAHVDSLLTAFAEADATVLENAAVAVAQLPTLTTCSDEQQLVAELPPPENPEAAARVSAARESLARARGQIDLGKYDDAVTIATEASSLASELDYRPLAAESDLVSGTAFLWRSQGPEAERALSEAARHAITSGHDKAAAEAIARRVYVRAEYLNETARAEADAWLVTSLVERTGNQPMLSWLADNNLAVVAERADDQGLAVARYRRALATTEAAREELRYQRAITLRNLGLVERGRYDDRAAEAYLTEAATLAESQLGSQHPLVATFIASAGAARLDMEHVEQAESELRRALAIAEASPESATSASTSVETLQYLAELARIYRRPDARELAERCISTARAIFGADHPRVDFYQIVLAANLHAGTPESLDEKLESWAQAVTVAGPLISARARELAADALIMRDAPALARRHTELALAMLDESTPPDNIERALPTQIKGEILLMLGQLDGAEAALVRSRELYTNAGNHRRATEPTRLLGDLHRARGHHDEAIAAYRETLETYESFDADHPELAALRLDLARAIVDAGGDREEARALANLALAAYTKLGDGFAPEAEAARAWLAS